MSIVEQESLRLQHAVDLLGLHEDDVVGSGSRDAEDGNGMTALLRAASNKTWR